MDWYLIHSGEMTGKENMELDYLLAKHCKPGEAFFRLFRWKPYAVSLGFNQSENEINHEKAGTDGIDIVKRPTGGRAILHSEELTYSVIMPRTKEVSAIGMYRDINKALLNGLAFYDERLSQAELETANPDFAALYNTVNGIACFASSAKSELKWNGRKIIGSAQRKLGNAILQHGSILCGTFHRRLVDYLDLSDSDKNIVKQDLLSKTIEIEEITGEKVNYLRLEASLVKAFAEDYHISFLDGAGRAEEVFSLRQKEFAQF